MEKVTIFCVFSCCCLAYAHAFIEISRFSRNADLSHSCPQSINANETYVLPVAEKPHQYMLCRKYSQFIINCPSEMLFDSTQKICSLSEQFERHRILGNIWYDYNSGSKHESCPSKDPKFPVLLPHTSDCNKFYICADGIAHEKVCQKGLHFNVKLKVCDYPETAGCRSFSSSKLYKSKLLRCPKLNLPVAQLLPHESCCELYYICESGKGILRNCPDGLHFNPKESVCDHPYRVQCEYIAATPGYKIKTTTKAVKVTGFPSPFCPRVNGKHPFFFRHTEDCTVYYMCSHGLAYEFTCPSGLHFNLRLNVCDHSETAGCLLGEKQKKN